MPSDRKFIDPAVYLKDPAAVVHIDPKQGVDRIDPRLTALTPDTNDEALPNLPGPPTRPNPGAVRDAISTGQLDPMDSIPLPPQMTKGYFLNTLRAYELKPGANYVVFVPEELFGRLGELVDQLQDLPWNAVLFPAKFSPDGEIQIRIGSYSQLLDWLDGNRPR